MYFKIREFHEILTKLIKSCLEIRLAILIAGFAEKSKHIFLVAFNAGLIKRIYTKHISADCTSLLQEIDEITEVVFIHLFHFKNNVRNITVRMCKDCSLICLFINK